MARQRTAAPPSAYCYALRGVSLAARHQQRPVRACDVQSPVRRWRCAAASPPSTPRPPRSASPPPAATAAPGSPSSIDASSVAINHFEGSTLCLEWRAPHLPRPVRVLIDPWLTGELVFGGAPTFFRARKPLAAKAMSEFGKFDVIVLSQELPDHCHVPTLGKLPRDLPVLCPVRAVPVLEDLAYQTILPLVPGDRSRPFPSDSLLAGLVVRAGPGSVTGPPWSAPQLAFCFEFSNPQDPSSRPLRVYLETHGHNDAKFVRELCADGRLDAVISPVVTTTIPVLGNYKVVNGVPELLDLCKIARPRVVVPFDNSRTPATGVLNSLTRQFGGQETFRRLVVEEQSLADVRIVEPLVMQPVVIAGGDTSRATQGGE
jgi:Beta-lactamase superfamily domain